MRRAAAQRSRARIPDAITLAQKFRIALLARRVGVVTDEEVPPQRGIFGREGMKRRNVVVRGPGRGRIAARLQDEHRKTGFGEPRGGGAATRAGSDDDVVGIAVGVHVCERVRSARAEDEGGFEEIAAIHARTSSGAR
jgi:hypothetical protein